MNIFNHSLYISTEKLNINMLYHVGTHVEKELPT